MRLLRDKVFGVLKIAGGAASFLSLIREIMPSRGGTPSLGLSPLSTIFIFILIKFARTSKLFAGLKFSPCLPASICEMYVVSSKTPSLGTFGPVH